MTVHRSSSSVGSFAIAAFSWRGLSHRFSFVLFSALAFLLLILSHAQNAALTSFRTHTIDTLAPVLDVIARPMTAFQNMGEAFRDLSALHDDNKRLRAENARMIEWQNAVVALEKENRELRGLLKFKTEPNVSYVSARVIADTGGAYDRGLIITAGKEDGVRPGMAAMTGEGLVGRVVEAGDRSSRVMLISDLNSRVPVMLAETGDRAILAGDNTAKPKMLFLARDAAVPDGARVMTSGHGGVFPPNLSVGVLRENSRGGYTVIPSADLGRITYVRLVDFETKSGLPAAESKARTENKKR